MQRPHAKSFRRRPRRDTLRRGFEALETRRLLAPLAEGEGESPWVGIQLTATDRHGVPISEIGAGETFFLEARVQDLRQIPLAGVFAAYSDVRFDELVAPRTDSANRLGLDIQFGDQYRNGTSGSAAPGLLDEIGAFQSSMSPLGKSAVVLWKVGFQAGGQVAQPDTVTGIAEDDGERFLSVLDNDQTQTATVRFTADPADELPLHEVLVFDPTTPVSSARVAYGSTELNIVDRGRHIVAVSKPSHGGMVRISAGGQGLYYQPAPDFFGRETLSYTLSGGATATVTIDVQASPDAPRAADDLFELPPSSVSTIDASQGLLANDEDADGDHLTASLVDPPLHGQLSLAPDGGFQYTPNEGFRGVDEFTYRVTDSSGQSSIGHVTLDVDPYDVLFRFETTDLAGQPIDQVQAGDPFQLLVTVTDIRPRHASGVFAAYLDVQFDDRLAGLNNPSSDIQARGGYENGLDPDVMQPGQIEHVGGFQTSLDPPGARERQVLAMTLQARGIQAGDDQFTGLREDGGEVELAVLENDLPAAGQLVFTGSPSSESPRFDVLMFDPAAPVPPDQQLFESIQLSVLPPAELRIESVSESMAGARVNVSEDGRSIVYEPPADFSGEDRLTYTLSDGSTAEVTVQVEPTNDPPRAIADAYSVVGGRRLEISAAAGLLANDYDVDSPNLQVELVTSPGAGTLQLDEDGGFVYLPDPNHLSGNELGLDTFTYRVFDGLSYSEAAEVQISLLPPPVELRLVGQDGDGNPKSEFEVGEPIWLAVYARDLRTSGNAAGIFAGYLDIGYNTSEIEPIPADNISGLLLEYGPGFDSGLSGTVSDAGLDELGGFRGNLDPPSRDQLLLRVGLTSPQLRGFDDSVRINSSGSAVTLPVLANERTASWQVAVHANPADELPAHDLLLFDPPTAVDPQDVRYGQAEWSIRNPGELQIVGVSAARHGIATVSPDGQSVVYQPQDQFEGQETLEYTFTDAQGREARGKLVVDVVASWQNLRDPFDVNSDLSVTPSDALMLVNDLNLDGARQLPAAVVGPPYIDVNGDRFISPVDALLVINHLNQLTTHFSEGETSQAEQGRAGGVPLPPPAWNINHFVTGHDRPIATAKLENDRPWKDDDRPWNEDPALRSGHAPTVSEAPELDLSEVDLPEVDEELIDLLAADW